MPPLAFDDCRTAARAVCAAESGRTAYASVRPRGITGLLRSRGPLPVILYVAAREGRLITRDPSPSAPVSPSPGLSAPPPPAPASSVSPAPPSRSAPPPSAPPASAPSPSAPPASPVPVVFGLVEQPVVDPAVRGGGLRLRVARLLDRHWELVLFSGPPVLGLAGAAVCLPFRGLWPVAVVVAVAVMVHVAVLMGGVVVMASVWLARALGGGASRGKVAAESLPAHQWTLRLFHCPESGHADELMTGVARGLRTLVTGRIEAVAARSGAGVDVRLSTALVAVVSGATTAGARAYLVSSSRTAKPYGASGEVVVLIPPDQPEGVTKRFVSTAGFLLWYVGGLLAVLLICAAIVADREGSACTVDCASRPSTFEDALRWLFGLADELRPRTPGTWVMGMVAGIARWTTLPVLLVAVWQRWMLAKHEDDLFDRTVASWRLPRAVIFVVTRVEYDAVVAAALSVRPDLAPWQEARRKHTVLRLGSFGGHDVMVVRSGPGPYSPGGLMAVALDLLGDLRPDVALLTGICFGLKDDEQAFGDVVVPSQVRDLDHRKVTDEAGQPRGDRPAPTPEVFGHLVNVGSRWPEPGPRVHIGPMGGSGTLYNSAGRRAEIVAEHPDLVAADMECHVLAAAAVRRETPWCVVRGISDRGMDKTDEHQRVAAENAARLVFEALTTAGPAGFRQR